MGKEVRQIIDIRGPVRDGISKLNKHIKLFYFLKIFVTVEFDMLIRAVR